MAVVPLFPIRERVTPLGLAVCPVITLAILAFVLHAPGYRARRIARRNEATEADGSMGDQMLGPHSEAKPAKPRSRAVQDGAALL